MQPELVKKLVGLGGTTLIGAILLNVSTFKVEHGHSAIKFSKFQGIVETQFNEGWHFKIPYFETPIDFDMQSRPIQLKASSLSRDMQSIVLTFRVLFRPQDNQLCKLYTQFGPNFDVQVLPSIVNDAVRQVIGQHSTSQLLSERDLISGRLKRALEFKALQYNIIIDDIKDLTFVKDKSETNDSKQKT